MSDIELSADHEVVLLGGAWELIDEMVNFALLDLWGNGPDTEVRLHTHIHQRYLNVLLVDFLSQTDRKLPVRQISFLGALQSISNAPNFQRNDSAAELKRTSTEFANWLEGQILVDTWMPSINV